jgi:glycosyltransferase involved in cell wall biosynthesis
MKDLDSISLVIPTLGGKSLFSTIISVNNGSLIPTEIIIVIPEENYNFVKKINSENIRIITTKSKGQVAQRLAGFKESRCKFVMQLDDDVELERDAIEKMLKVLKKLGPKNAIGPRFIDPKTLKNLHKFDIGFVGFLKSLNALVFCAAPWGQERMGKITKLAISYGADPDFYDDEICEVDWLPGGCILNYSEDLVFENYYPFEGKAYSEDVLQSILRSSKNINHYVAFKISVKTEIDENNFNWLDFISDFNVKLYIISLIGGSKIRLYMWGFSQFLIRLIKWQK